MAKALRIALAVAAAALTAGAFLLFSGQEKSVSTQTTSVPSGSPGAGWTEEEMRNARGQDMTVGPSAEALMAGGAALAALTILLVVRRRSSSR